MPKISVCIPTYNRASLLRQAIDSVLTQDINDWELLVSDNSSTDDTPSVVGGYHDPRIRLLRQPQNIGMYKNFNAVLRQARGQYVKMLMDDDVLHPKCLRRQIEILDQFPNVNVVCSDYIAIDAKNARIESIYFHKDTYRIFTSSQKEPGIEFIINYLLGRRAVGLPSAITFRRLPAEKIGNFDEQIGNPLDADLWLRLCQFGDFYYLDEPLLSMRWHTNASKEYVKGPYGYRDVYDLTRKHFKLNEQHPIFHKYKNKIFRRVARLMMDFYLRGTHETRKQIWQDFTALPVSMLQRLLLIISFFRYFFVHRLHAMIYRGLN